jgi:hypothetical protein
VQDMKLHAESAAIDLGGAQLDQFEQLFVDAGFCGGTAKREDGVVSIGASALKSSYSRRACDISIT